MQWPVVEEPWGRTTAEEPWGRTTAEALKEEQQRLRCSRKTVAK